MKKKSNNNGCSQHIQGIILTPSIFCLVSLKQGARKGHLDPGKPITRLLLREDYLGNSVQKIKKTAYNNSYTQAYE